MKRKNLQDEMRNHDTVLTAITPTVYCVKTNTHTLLRLFFALNQSSPKDYILPADILWEIKAFIFRFFRFYFDSALFFHGIIVEKLFIAVLEQQLIRGKKNTRRFSTMDREKSH